MNLSSMWMNTAFIVLCAYNLRLLYDMQGWDMPRWIGVPVGVIVVIIFGLSLLITVLHREPEGV